MKSTPYKIKKGGEPPKTGRTFGQLVPIADLKSMEVGEHFVFPSIDEKRVTTMVEAYGKKNGGAFLINIGDECTCWRTD